MQETIIFKSFRYHQICSRFYFQILALLKETKIRLHISYELSAGRRFICNTKSYFCQNQEIISSLIPWNVIPEKSIVNISQNLSSNVVFIGAIRVYNIGKTIEETCQDQPPFLFSLFRYTS